MALKFIGFSLNEIKKILSRGAVDLATALRQQHEALAEKRDRLDLAIQAIQRAEYVVSSSNDPGPEAFVKIIEVIRMQTDMNWSKKYYSEEAQKEIAKRAATIPREVIEQGQRYWAVLIKEVEAARSHVGYRSGNPFPLFLVRQFSVPVIEHILLVLLSRRSVRLGRLVARSKENSAAGV